MQKEQDQCGLADYHYQQKLWRLGFIKLRDNVELNFKKIVLLKKCDIFLTENFLKLSFIRWKSVYSGRIIEKTNTEKALWFW